MYKPNTKPKERIFVDSFDKAHEAIYKLMPDLSALLQKDEELKHKLFEIDFLTNQKGDVIVSLIYHKKLDETATLQRLEVVIPCATWDIKYPLQPMPKNSL